MKLKNKNQIFIQFSDSSLHYNAGLRDSSTKITKKKEKKSGVCIKRVPDALGAMMEVKGERGSEGGRKRKVFGMKVRWEWEDEGEEEKEIEGRVEIEEGFEIATPTRKWEILNIAAMVQLLLVLLLEISNSQCG